MAANKKAGQHPSYIKLKWSPSSIARKRKYDKEYHATEERKEYRAKLNKANRKMVLMVMAMVKIKAIPSQVKWLTNPKKLIGQGTDRTASQRKNKFTIFVL